MVPARAGVILAACLLIKSSIRGTRASGGDPGLCQSLWKALQWYPRERG